MGLVCSRICKKACQSAPNHRLQATWPSLRFGQAPEADRYAEGCHHMATTEATTTRTIFLKSKPHVYTIASIDDPHQRTLGDWIIRETWSEIDDSTLPDRSVQYSVVIETDVSTPEEIWAKRDAAYELADDLNRIWIYVCGEPLNAPRLGLVEMNAPPAWTTNAKEVEEELHASISRITCDLSIQTRYHTYCPELPLAKALEVWESYRTGSDVIRTLIELHYSALTSERSQARYFFFAKALEIVQALLPGQRNEQKQNLLPADITNDLDQSLHWLFSMANNRSDVRHVFRIRTSPRLILACRRRNLGRLNTMQIYLLVLWSV
jgi:hypothetical protein